MFTHQMLYLVLLALSLISVTQQQVKDPAIMEAFLKFREQCAKEQGLELDYVKKNWDENRFPNDNKMKCYFKCVNLKLGIMSETGEVIDDMLKKVTAVFNDAATNTEIVVECGNIEGADLCETAYKLAACVRSAQLD